MKSLSLAIVLALAGVAQAQTVQSINGVPASQVSTVEPATGTAAHVVWTHYAGKSICPARVPYLALGVRSATSALSVQNSPQGWQLASGCLWATVTRSGRGYLLKVADYPAVRIPGPGSYRVAGFNVVVN